MDKGRSSPGDEWFGTRRVIAKAPRFLFVVRGVVGTLRTTLRIVARSVGLCHHLEVFDARHCGSIDELPAQAIETLKAAVLRLDGNLLQSPPLVLFTLPHLKCVSLENNQIVSSFHQARKLKAPLRD